MAYKNMIRSIGVVVAVVATVLLPEVAMAAGGFDPATATSGSSASSWIDTAAQWMLGIIVGIWGVRKVLAFFGR
ncbi:hypothetical protein RFI41_15915 [Acinetobacter nosocomialis]|uniref:hypothetical protein n=1 Tax=Acinetobacter nosocomialis TaxID=106654 RepID=UPI00280E71F3|nr:hypothetical protein [Acinetobacter nosocomialis]MDQ8804163.1 hypothetical protein [Acinetobacter nosocomialis]MDQ8850361.1 hypothetical protein [Acinetobacter nosocomialis]MDQ8854414.1 hypothetical protein [Acinetobacter nosocomialis]MDQ8894491.1 hypothetical protein [Acinetobacter nosocomialis]